MNFKGNCCILNEKNEDVKKKERNRAKETGNRSQKCNHIFHIRCLCGRFKCVHEKRVSKLYL